MFEADFQVVVDSLVRDLAEQCQIRNTNLLLLGGLEDGLLDLGFPPAAAVANIGRSFGATEATLLLTTGRASRLTLNTKCAISNSALTMPQARGSG